MSGEATRKVFTITTVAEHTHCLGVIAHLPRGKRWTVEVSEKKRKRSVSANAFYWGMIVTPLAEHVGETPEQMHEILLSEFYGFTVKTFRGKEYRVPNRRSSDMTTQEFSEHIQRAQALAAEEGIDSGPMFGDTWQG